MNSPRSISITKVTYKKTNLQEELLKHPNFKKVAVRGLTNFRGWKFPLLPKTS